MSASQARSWKHSYAQEQTQNEKSVVKVRKTGWITKGEKVLYSIIGVCLIVGCIFMVSYASSTDSLNREIESLDTVVQKQEVENEGLLYEMKELSNPDRITRIARENGFQIQDADVKQAHAFKK
ncbi:MAG TPA: cell division protein FtsL [Virgibacillus sp.]|nr:cell division protein FtsL [Virgibacillus sp.]